MSYMLIGSTGTVVFEKTATVTDESPTMSSQVTSSPIEGGGKITDHAVLDPIIFTITGVVASPAEYAALEAMWRGRPDHHSGCPDQWGLPGGLRRP